MRAQRPRESALLLLDAIDMLVRNDVPYAVVGGDGGVGAWVVRASLDAEVILGVHSDALAAIERRFALQPRGLHRGDPRTGSGSFLARHRSPVLRARLRVISLEDFIAMKLFAHGPQDAADATAALEAAERIDVALLRKLAARFGPDNAASLESLLGHAKLSR